MSGNLGAQREKCCSFKKLYFCRAIIVYAKNTILLTLDGTRANFSSNGPGAAYGQAGNSIAEVSDEERQK
jgi:hypothetical protein